MFTVYQDAVRQFRWRYTSSNGRIIADSGEGYVRKEDCLRGIDIMKREAPNAPVHDTTVSYSYR